MVTMARLRADLLLLLAALIWGSAFVAQKTANDSMGPLMFVGCRFILSAALLAPLAWIESRRSAVGVSVRDCRLGLVIGFCLFGTMAMQQIGMVTTSVTNAGFLTALYVIMVPILGWLVTRAAPRPVIVIACVVSLSGTWLLEQNGAVQQWQSGDLWVLASDLACALQILLVGQFLGRTNRPYLLSFAQYAVTGMAGLILGLLLEPVMLAGIWRALPSILYAGLLSGGVAFTLQIVAQRHTPAAEAAIIMSLESVFAATAGALLLHDRLSDTAYAGCALILLGVIVVPLSRGTRFE
jgi:drug/metabolite transporter (DMT)-like permease